METSRLGKLRHTLATTRKGLCPMSHNLIELFPKRTASSPTQQRWFDDPLLGRRVELRTLRYSLARRPVLCFSRLEKVEGIYPLINAVSVSPLQVVEEGSRKFRPKAAICALRLVTSLTITT